MSNGDQDIRWKQRFSNYKDALQQLQDAVDLYNDRELTNLEKQGLIQSFEFTYELGWKTLQDYLREVGGYTGISGPNSVIEQAFQDGYIDGGAWAAMNESRKLTSHTYNEGIAEEVLELIVTDHIISLQELEDFLSKEDEEND